MKKYIIVVVMLLTALLLCGCNGELSDLMDMPFNEESEIVLVIGKYDGDKFPIEEGVCFYAFDKHNTAYKVVWSDTGELLENSVVIVSYTKMNKPEVSENEGFADAEYEIIATSVRYTDDELAAKTVIEKKTYAAGRKWGGIAVCGNECIAGKRLEPTCRRGSRNELGAELSKRGRGAFGQCHRSRTEGTGGRICG